MNNEEIIAAGGDNMLELLWNNNQGFIRQQAYRWAYTGRGAELSTGEQEILFEDLVQCGFLAIADAVKHYDPEKASFITALGYYIKKHFRRWCASVAGWTVHQYDEVKKRHIKVDSLNRVLSNEESDDNTELGDLIADPDDHIEELIDRLYIDSLHNKLEKLLAQIPKQEAEVIRLRYYKNKTQEEIGTALGLSRSRAGQLLASGMRNLRTEALQSDIRDYVDKNTDYYTRVGVDTFHSTGTSAVELIVMRRENLLNGLLNKARKKEAHNENC